MLWTINFKSSSQALIKEISLLLIPLSFFLNPVLLKEEKDKIIKYYSYSIFVYTLFCLLKALVQFGVTKKTEMFFYHELVSFDVNAIHVSIYVSIAFFAFFLKKSKTVLDKFAISTLLIFMFLLSSKNIIIVFTLLLVLCLFTVLKIKVRKNKMYLVILSTLVIGILFYGKIKERFLIEIDSNKTENSINNQISTANGLVYNVSIKDAWTKEKFQANDYFPGTALRVYQVRIFKELIQDDKSVFFTGYGLNATYAKIEQKSIEHNLYTAYGKFNFHNQYIQIFAELGVFGFILLVLLLGVNLKNAIKSKHFIHFSFAILMISLFLTESFLSRQRGIVFFTIMYCLFNSGIVKNHSIKE